MKLIERLHQAPILADGAMGTRIYEKGVPYDHCFDELNLSRPQLIQEIHREYIRVGAQLIETNTFGANRIYLGTHGLEHKVREINFQGARIAREAREVAGEPVLIAGSVGPIGKLIEPIGKISLQEVYDVFKEQIGALLEGGVDLIVLETFPSLEELKQAIRAAKDSCDLPILAQLTFNEEGTTPYGDIPELAAQVLSQLPVDVMGVNCSVGPMALLDVVEKMVRNSSKPVSVMPNAGLPRMMAGRYIYFSSPQHFADYAKKFLELGVKIIGGCCGTTPDHIQAMLPVLQKTVLPAQRAPVEVKERTPEPKFERVKGELPRLGKALEAGRFVVSVELDPPKGINPKKLLDGARMLKKRGIEFVNIADSPMSRLRMSALTVATMVEQQVGLETILHYTCRDRNLMALQSELLGAYALGLRNILALTGDPPSLGNYPNATAVFDLDSIGLVHVIRKMNEGMDWAGNSIGSNANFYIGIALNPAADDLTKEYERFWQKVEAGGNFIMTQPLYDVDLIDRFLNQLKACKLPVLLGLLPLQSSRHAEFLHHEVPGIVIPETVRKRMRDAGENGIAEGVKMSQEILQQVKDRVAGAYLMPSFGRYEVCAEVAQVVLQ